MTKRYTETEKWNSVFFQELSVEYKLIWFYLIENCDYSGIWKINLRNLEYFTGIKTSIFKIKKNFNNKILIKNEILFIPSFIEQQGNFPLNIKNNAHNGIYKKLKKHNLIDSKFQIILKNESICSENIGEKVTKKIHKKTTRKDFDLEVLYKIYPKKEGKTKGLQKCKSIIKNESDYNSILNAIENYSKKCNDEETEKKFIKQFSTFMNCWEDYSEYKSDKMTEQEIEDFMLGKDQPDYDPNKRTLIDILKEQGANIQ